MMKYKLFNVMNKDLTTIEAQIIDLLSHYWKWSESELFKRKGDTNQVHFSLICILCMNLWLPIVT